MKYVILHFFFIVHLCNIKCDTIRRHKSRHGRYDINGFITQLLASRRFDELAEKLAEKAANKIMNIKGDQTHIDRASDYNDTETESAKYNTQNPPEEKHERKRVQLTRSSVGKIDPEAVMNETILLTENLKLKYKYLKNNAEKKIKYQRELANKNVTNEELKQNKTEGLVDGEHTKGNETEEQIAELNEALQIQNDENQRTTDDTKDVMPKNYFSNTEGITFHSGNDAERNESSQKNDPKEPSLVHEPGLDQESKNLNVVTNSGVEVKDQDPNHVENVIKEDNPSSLDEQNQQYVPSAEKTTTELDRSDEETQKQATKESSEFGNAVAYFRGREDDVEENKVPLESEQPSPYEGIDRSVASNEKGNPEFQEQVPENQSSREKADEEPAKPIIRREGDKVYTYVQNPEYKDYHEEMAKWQKEHPENPADFL